MGAYLSTPNREKCCEDSDNYRFTVGAASMQGWRLSQEDAHNAILSFSPGCSYFGVYDGHGGSEVAAYTALHLPSFIKESAEFKNGVFDKALEECFIRFDETLIRAEVIASLRKLMNKEEEGEEADAEEVNHLYQEATMPIEDVIARFKDGEVQISTSSDPPKNKDLERVDACSSGSNKQSAKSPFLTGKRGNNNGANNKHIHFDENGTPEEEEEEKQTANGEAKKEEPKNGEVKEEVKKEEVVLSNGSAGAKGKGKGKGKGKSNQLKPLVEGEEEQTEEAKVEEKDASPKKSPKKSALELYQNMLAEEGSSSDEDTDDDDAFPNAKEESSDDDDVEDEEDSEPDTEDDDDDDETEMMGPCNVKEEPGNDSGCTAVVGLIVKNELFVANAGDSRCVVCRNGEAIEMSMDHKPEDEPEKKRIEKAGGNVTADGRVDGGLNLSRALGDHAYKQNASLPLVQQMISPQPDIKTLTLDPATDTFIILACDGIWNSMSSQEVVDFIKPRMEKNPDNMSSICEELFDACLAPDTSGDGTGCDNMTAVIIKIKDSYNPLNEATTSSSKRPLESSSQSSSKKCKTDDDDESPSASEKKDTNAPAGGDEPSSSST